MKKEARVIRRNDLMRCWAFFDQVHLILKGNLMHPCLVRHGVAVGEGVSFQIKKLMEIVRQVLNLNLSAREIRTLLFFLHSTASEEKSEDGAQKRQGISFEQIQCMRDHNRLCFRLRLEMRCKHLIALHHHHQSLGLKVAREEHYAPCLCSCFQNRCQVKKGASSPRQAFSISYPLPL